MKTAVIYRLSHRQTQPGLVVVKTLNKDYDDDDDELNIKILKIHEVHYTQNPLVTVKIRCQYENHYRKIVLTFSQ